MMNRKKHLIVIGGATATGKTSLAIAVAKHFQTAIISADSRQFFREMNIGTAKPAKEELEAVPHHFINSISIHEEYSVGDFERDALALLERLFVTHDIVVSVGGSGMYIKALCEGLHEFPPVSAAIRAELASIYQNEGIEALQQELSRKDPVYYGQVDKDNPQRLLRALSVCRASGRPYSSFLGAEKLPRRFIPIYILLQLEKQFLYEKINRRVDAMMQQGLLEEARALYPYRALNALQTVGYQELFDYLEGKITLEAAVAAIKQNTRRYAKRQQTWFRKDEHWKAFAPNDVDGVIHYIQQSQGR